MQSLAFDSRTSASEFAIWLESQSAYQHCDTELLAVLEGNEFTQGLRSRELARLRGYVLATLERIGAPDYAIPIAIENLTFGIDPYLIAASAKALRGWKKSCEIVPALLTAMENVANVDDLVSFNSFRPSYPLQDPTSATIEIVETLRWLGNEAAPHFTQILDVANSSSSAIPLKYRDDLRAIAQSIEVKAASLENPSCCSIGLIGRRKRINQLSPNSVEAEDQDGQVVPLSAWIGQARYTIITFYYSRCENPRKCSANITKFAALQKRIESSSLGETIQFAAITYDPEFDRANRLLSYGQSRGFAFGARSKFLRITKGYEPFRNAISLLVEYTGSVVNQHAIELFVFDARSHLVKDFSRIPWTPEGVLAFLENPTNEKSQWGGAGSIGGGISGLISSTIIAMLPKCPFCWSMYLSAIGVSTVTSIAAWRGIIVFAMFSFIVLIWMSYRQCRITSFWPPFFLSLTGVVLLSTSLLDSSFANYRPLGLICVVLASLLGHWYMATHRYYRLFR